MTRCYRSQIEEVVDLAVPRPVGNGGDPRWRREDLICALTQLVTKIAKDEFRKGEGKGLYDAENASRPLNPPQSRFRTEAEIQAEHDRYCIDW